MFIRDVKFSIHHFWRTAPGHGHIVLNNNFIGKFSLTPEELSLYREVREPVKVKERLYKEASKCPLVSRKTPEEIFGGVSKLLPAVPVQFHSTIWHLTDYPKKSFLRQEYLEPLTVSAREMLLRSPINLNRS